MSYTEELMQTIRDDETEFIKTYQAISDIQEGKWDEQLESAQEARLKEGSKEQST